MNDGNFSRFERIGRQMAGERDNDIYGIEDRIARAGYEGDVEASQEPMYDMDGGYYFSPAEEGDDDPIEEDDVEEDEDDEDEDEEELDTDLEEE